LFSFIAGIVGRFMVETKSHLKRLAEHHAKSMLVKSNCLSLIIIVPQKQYSGVMLKGAYGSCEANNFDAFVKS
jgi:hypothetical protein